jgi:hypothetical protein
MKIMNLYSPTTEQLDPKDTTRTVQKFLEVAEFVKKMRVLKALDTLAASLALANIGVQYFIVSFKKNDYLYYTNEPFGAVTMTTDYLCAVNLILVLILRKD